MASLSAARPALIARRPRRASLLSLFSLRRQRDHLAMLDDAALRDIGLTRTEAAAEAARPFWDAPDAWKR